MEINNLNQINNILNNRMYVLYGEQKESYESVLYILKNKYLNTTNYNFIRIDNNSFYNILYELLNSPKLTIDIVYIYIVYDLYINDDETNKILSILKKNNIYLFVLNKKNMLINNQQVCFINCVKYKIFIAIFVLNCCSDKKIKIENKYIKFLVEQYNFDVKKIHIELNKILSYCYGKNEITMQDINILTNDNQSYKIYELINMIDKKNTKTAIDIINFLLKNKYEPMSILTYLINCYKNKLYDINNTCEQKARAMTIINYLFNTIIKIASYMVQPENALFCTICVISS